jgi:hypothetical protein
VPRLLIAVAVALLGLSSPVLAKPRVAVAPLAGDSDGRMGAVIRDALDGKLVVVAPKEVERGLEKLGLSGELAEADLEKLRDKLDAPVVVQGKLGRAGKKKTLKLSVAVRGKEANEFTVQYRSISSETFRDTVRAALLKRIGSIDELEREEKKRVAEAEEERARKRKAEADAEEERERAKKKKAEEDDEDRPRKKKKRLADADEPKRKKAAEDDEDRPRKKKKKPADADEDKPKQADADEDRPKKKAKKVADSDDGRLRARKRRRRGDGDGDGEGVSEPVARPLFVARVDAGVSYSARSLTYAVAADSTMKPPSVLTPAPTVRIEGEIYPLALSDRSSPAAVLGLFGAYDKTFGLAIDVPNSMGKAAPIDQAHYVIGARYRRAFGSAAIAAGLGYERRHYIADRGGLGTSTLDAPDVDYAAVVPGIAGRVQVTPKLSLFADATLRLALSAGPIATGTWYGSGSVWGAGGDGGVDFALGKQIGLRVAGEINQMNLSFNGTGMAKTRKVSGATDRELGIVATLAAMY